MDSCLFLYQSLPVWSDGYIIFQYLAIYKNENLPNNRSGRFKILPNAK